MAEQFHRIVQVPDRTYQSLARVELKKLAVQVGFNASKLAEVEIIIAEITSNHVKHSTGGGTILCKVLSEEKSSGLELISFDNGPGMQVERTLVDGFSTTNTLGQGLGAIQRLSDEFDIYSMPGWGTVLFSRVYTKKKSKTETEVLHVDILQTAKPGEDYCGDNWSSFSHNKRFKIAVIDGLGHGIEASKAAELAVEGFALTIKDLPNEQLRIIHHHIRKSRGAVISIFNIDIVNNQMIYCGVGNISAKMINQFSLTKGRSCHPYNGIIGHALPNTLNNNILTWDNKNDALVIHSDGLNSRWDISRYPQILKHHGMIFCTALFKDFNRSNDDTTIALVRHPNK